MDDIERTKLEVQLHNQQRVLNKKYAEKGLTDEILDEQIQLNRLRHEYDIPDDSKKVYGDFVQ